MAKAYSQQEVSEALYRYNQFPTERLATVDDVSDEHIKRFWDDGYLVVDQLLTPDEISAGIQDILDITHGRIIGPQVQWMKKKDEVHTPEERELVVRKLQDYIDYAPALHHIAHHPGIIGMVERMMGEESKIIANQAIMKPPSPEAGIEKPWHQDMAYGGLSYTKMVIGAWVALDDADLDNGCMHVIPRSHMEGPVPHYAVRDWQLCDTSVQVSRDVAIPLKAGGVLFFTGLTHHGTPPNFSNKRRRALQFHYAPKSAEKITPQEYKRIYTNEMTNAEC